MIFGLFKKPDPGVVAAGVPRSSKWPPWLKAFLKGKTCVVCGAEDELTGHHVVPFHEDPSRELDEDNVEPVCKDVCHLLIGHLKDWRLTNPDFRKHAAELKSARMAAKKEHKHADVL